MSVYISPNRSFRVLRFLGTHLRIWPDDNKKWNFKTDVFFWFCVINYVLLLLPLFNALYLNRKNVVAASNTWIEVSGYAEVLAAFIYSKYKRVQLYVLLCEAEKYLLFKKVTIIKKYANTYAKIFLLVIVFYLFTVFVYWSIEKPITGYEHLITTAVYPFNIRSHPIKGLIYCNQTFNLVYSSILPVFDGISVLLIFNCTHRLKILEHKFKLAKTSSDLSECVREHDDVSRTIKETNSIVRFLVFKTVCSFTSNVIPGGLQILNNVALSQSICQVCIILLVYSRIVLCAECAGNMTDAGEDLLFTVYSTLWYNEEPKIVSMKIFIIQKCQNIPAIHIKGIMSGLGRKYLLTIMYSTFSYLTTLRTVTSDEKS
ncbi:odorant receptor 56 [Nasonia vitripennis]|uniref:Odorant receptor n=1 Tax=Nasonia vitripennis TaxID=7425 RepID=A0A7M6UMN1_NASVI|nr:odorant receptor 56 [Nasonia vitripennis]